MTIATTTLLTTTKAAELLHVSADTLRRWTEKGVIDSTLTEGGHRRYREEDVLALSFRQQGQSPASPQEQLLQKLLAPKQDPAVAYSADIRVMKSWTGEPGSSQANYEVIYEAKPLNEARARLTPEEVRQLMSEGVCREGEVEILGWYSRETGFTISAYIGCGCLTIDEDTAKEWGEDRATQLKAILEPAQPAYGVVGITNARQVSKGNIPYCHSQQEAEDLESPLFRDVLAG